MFRQAHGLINVGAEACEALRRVPAPVSRVPILAGIAADTLHALMPNGESKECGLLCTTLGAGWYTAQRSESESELSYEADAVEGVCRERGKESLDARLVWALPRLAAAEPP